MTIPSGLGFGDRVKQLSSTTGTGDFTLGAAVSSKFQTITAAGIAALTPVSYVIEHQGNGVGEWEVGYGHLSDATTFVRDTVTSSSNAGSLVNFSAGLKHVAITVISDTLQQILAELQTGIRGVAYGGSGADLSAGVGLWRQASNGSVVTATQLLLTDIPDNLITSDKIVSLATSKLSGVVALANGGAGANLSATGGATSFLRQVSTGAAVTVSGIVSADLTTALTTPPAIGTSSQSTGKFTTLETTGNTGLGAAPGTYRLEVTSALEPGLKITNTNGGAGGSWYHAIGGGTQYAAGYYVISQGVPTASNYEMQFQGGGIVQVKASISSPAFASFITGVGNSAILSWTNTGGNFNGYAALGARHFNAGTNGSDSRIYMGTSAASKIELRDWNEIIYATMLKSGLFGLGAITPTAPLDVSGDIIRQRTSKTPASAAAAGNTGDWCWDGTYEYRCVSTNTWQRVARSTW